MVKARMRASGSMFRSTGEGPSDTSATSMGAPIRDRKKPATLPVSLEQRRLGEHLPDQAPATGPDGQPQGHLATTGDAARQEQVHDIGARNQQHERHRGHEQHDRPGELPAQVGEAAPR